MTQPAYLGLDTASHEVTVSVRIEGQRASKTLELGQTSVQLLRTVDELLTEVAATPPDLAALACIAGPGSFTGIRIGLATALGLAEGLDLPAVAVSGHWAQAWAAAEQGHEGAICSLLPSHGGRWSVQRFRLEQVPRARSPIESVAAPPTDETLVASQSACRAHLGDHGVNLLWVAPLADALADLAATAKTADSSLNWNRTTLLQPIYGAGPAVATTPRVPAHHS